MLQDLLKQKAEIEAQIKAFRSEERIAAIRTIHQLIAEHELSPAELGLGSSHRKPVKHVSKPASSIAPKFRNSKGETWSGRGLQPRWLRQAIAGGATLEQFRIAA